MDAVGAHQFWGFSPALDLQQLLRTVFGSLYEPSSVSFDAGAPTVSPSAETAATETSGHTAADTKPSSASASGEKPGASEPLCFLLVQPGDPRHIIKTISQRYRHSERPLHFYIFEKPLEVLARDILLLAAAFDWEVPIRPRATTWLEIYGNAMIQSRTAKYISAKLKPVLIDLLCSSKGPFPLSEMIDFSLLKYKQRDEIETIFKSYDTDVPFDMATLRDYRLRHEYGTRYDFRNNLIDWDYQNAVKPNAGCIHFTQYREWRNSGVAFEFGDQVYDCPNRTLASYVEGRERGGLRGASKLVRGFWGDLVVSPYHAVATAAYVPTKEEADAAGFAEALDKISIDAPSETVKNGNYAFQLYDVLSRGTGSEQWRHHAVEIGTYNVISWLYELENAVQYLMPKDHDIFSGLAIGTPTESDSLRTSRHIARSFDRVKVFPFTGDFEELLSKRKLANKFHVVCLSGKAVHYAGHKDFSSLFPPSGGVVVAETARNVVNLKRDQQVEFGKRLIAILTEAGAALVGSDRQMSADTYPLGSSVGSAKEVAGQEFFTGSASWLVAVPGAESDAHDRSKRVPMVLYSQSIVPAPPVKLLTGGKAKETIETASTAVKSLTLQGYSGDNPPPEALVFAIIPSRIEGLRAVWETLKPKHTDTPSAPAPTAGPLDMSPGSKM